MGRGGGGDLAVVIIGTPSHALIREELELADLVGYDRRIPAVEYYDWVVKQ